MNSPTERIVFVVLLIFIIVTAVLERKSIADWFKRRQYGFLGWFGHECPYCHTRYLHKKDMENCRHDRWDGKGIKSQRWYEDSGWPRGL